MDNIIQRLSRQPERRPEQYKKFNPNPPPEFPSYEQWVQQAQTAEKQEVQRPPEFPSYEDWQSQTTGGTLPSHFQMETPTEEGGMPTETGYPDVLNQIMGTYGIQDPMEALDLLISMSAGEQGLLGLTGLPGEEGVEGVEGKPISYLSLTPNEAQQKYEAGELTDEDWKSWVSYQKDIASLEKITGEGITDVQTDITRMMDEGLIYEQIWEFLTNKETGLGLSNSDATKEISEWVEKNNQDIPLK